MPASPQMSCCYLLSNSCNTACDRRNAFSGGAFFALNNFELDRLAFGERSKSLSCDGAVVDKNVSTVGAFDEAEAL